MSKDKAERRESTPRRERRDRPEAWPRSFGKPKLGVTYNLPVQPDSWQRVPPRHTPTN